MATITLNAAFDMDVNLSYQIETSAISASATETQYALGGNTLILKSSAGTVTEIQVLDSGDAILFSATGVDYDIADINVDAFDAGFLDVFILVGNALIGNDVVNGSAGDDVLFGFEGNDKIKGGAGLDVMSGGNGNDTYYVDNLEESATENFDEGTDTVRSTVNHTLALYVEKLILTGTDAINGTGNDENNSMTGNDAANILNGGAGDDTLIGKAGGDTYEVDSTGDIIAELAGQGSDHVLSTAASFVLADNVEKLTLLGSAASGTDNALNNTLVGNATVGSTLAGLAGNDKMTGLAGDDNLSGGAGNDKLTGGEGNDALHGNAGTDNMIGGLGNDKYWVEIAQDVVTEAVEAGEDSLYANFTIKLADYANVENLILTGSGNINGTGTGEFNDLSGNSGNNVLSGGGGDDYLLGKGGNDNLKGGGGGDNMNAGNGDDLVNGGAGFDTMAGGEGNDTFIFNTSLDLDPNNSVIDFVSGADKLRLDQTIFTELQLGTLGSGQFVIGAAALDANDRIIYDDGNLYYDADGNGAGAAVQFANISGGPTLVAADIVIVG